MEHRVLSALITLCVLPAAAAASTGHWEDRVALEGEPAPDTGGGTFSAFRSPVPSVDGSVVFEADVAAGSTLWGLFLDGWTGLEAVAVQGQSAPVNPPQLFLAFLGIPGAIEGFTDRVAFVAALAPATPAQFGLFLRASDGTLTEIAKSGDAAPGTGGDFDAFHAPRFNFEGDLLLRATLTGASASSGLFLLDSDGSGGAAIALAGDPAPGVPGGVFTAFGDPTVPSLGFFTPDPQDVAFPATVSAGGTPKTGVFTCLAGSCSLVALEGDPAPGGGSYGAFGERAIDVAYADGSLTFTDSAGVYEMDQHGVELVARSGEVARGTGGTFGAFASPPWKRRGWGSLFFAEIVGAAASEGIFLMNPYTDCEPVFTGGCQLALTGDPAPGTGGGEYADFTSPITYDRLGSDTDHYVAYTASVAGGSAASGVFLMPEPGGAGPWLAGAFLVARLARRRRTR